MVIGVDDLESDRKENLDQRLKSIVEYARWVKRTPNEVWSRQQKEMIDSVLKSADKIKREGIELE